MAPLACTCSEPAEICTQACAGVRVVPLHTNNTSKQDRRCAESDPSDCSSAKKTARQGSVAHETARSSALLSTPPLPYPRYVENLGVHCSSLAAPREPIRTVTCSCVASPNTMKGTALRLGRGACRWRGELHMLGLRLLKTAHADGGSALVGHVATQDGTIFTAFRLWRALHQLFPCDGHAVKPRQAAGVLGHRATPRPLQGPGLPAAHDEAVALAEVWDLHVNAARALRKGMACSASQPSLGLHTGFN